MELAIGIDIGGTSTKVALINSSGEILDKGAFASHGAGGAEAFLPNLLQAVSGLTEGKAGQLRLAGIGVGAPSCNEAAGTIEGAANLPFRTSFPLVELLKQTYGLPVFLTKDSNAALLGESRYGIARGLQDVLLLTLGTGLGSALMANGRLVKGGTAMAGEAGHILVAGNRRKCACGKTGCLETYASATGLKRTVMALLAEELTDSSLRRYSYDQLDAHQIFLAALAGDALAARAFEITGRVLGGKLAELVTIFEPEAIVLAGGMAEAGALLAVPLKEEMENDLLDFHKNKVRILNTALAANEAALLGAASLVWDAFQPAVIT